MSYPRPRRAIGSATSTALISVGANAVVPGSGVFVGTGLSLLNSLFGGGQDDARKVRVAWTLQEANQNSPTAAAIIDAAPGNVADDEAGFWRTALTQVSPAILAHARQLYPSGYWPKNLPDFYTDVNGATHQQILREVSAGGGINAPAVSSSSGVGLPAMQTTAPFNWTPILIASGLGLAAVAFALTRPNGRRH